MVDDISYVQGSIRTLVIIHCPHVSTATLSKWGGGGVPRGAQAYLLCSQYLVSLGPAWAERDMGALYISIPGLWGVVPFDATCLSHRPAAH